MPASTGNDGDLVSETGSVWVRHVLISFCVCRRVLLGMGRMRGRGLKKKKKRSKKGRIERAFMTDLAFEPCLRVLTKNRAWRERQRGKV